MTVSVVITCHNYGRYLRECLESILAQTRLPEEVLVVDDASTDDTPAIAAEYQAFGVRYDRVEYRDACRSYNHGISATTGDLIAYVDADNALTPRFIATLAALLEEAPDLAFAYSDRFLSGEASVAAWAEIGAIPGQTARSYPPDPAMLIHHNFIDTTAIIRRSVAVAVGGFRTLAALWDYRFWMMVLEEGYSGRYVPESLYYYRLHDGNMILSTRPQHRGLRLLLQREHFSKPFWAPYTRPELGLTADLVPGQALPGATPCHLFLTPEVIGTAYPTKVRLDIALPAGVEYLDGACDRAGARFMTRGVGARIEVPYPVPDGVASAIPPIVRLTVIARQGGEVGTIAVTLAWEDIFGGEHGLTEQIPLPTLVVRPPLQLPLTPGGIQTIRGQFGPGEVVTVWAAMPDGAPRAALTLPQSKADGEGVIRVDCRQAPRGFAGIVVQGELLRNLVVLVPQAAAAATSPRPLSSGGLMGRRVLARLRGGGQPRARR